MQAGQIDYQSEYSARLKNVVIEGGTLTADCPFCYDGAGEFHVDISTGRFWCHRCYEYGNLARFISMTENVTADEAEEQLRQKYDVY